jgi:hypothetical protein
MMISISFYPGSIIAFVSNVKVTMSEHLRVIKSHTRSGEGKITGHPGHSHSIHSQSKSCFLKKSKESHCAAAEIRPPRARKNHDSHKQ